MSKKMFTSKKIHLHKVPIYQYLKKDLKFLNKDILYQFVVMLNGYLHAMRVFTKISKLFFPYLRKL